MKKYLDYSFLLAPALLWWLSSLLLGDQFTLPNRLMLAVLCTAAGAGAMLTNRKLPGAFSLVAGLCMLASVPVQHEVPQAALTLRMGEYDLSDQPNLTTTGLDDLLHHASADLISIRSASPAPKCKNHVSVDFPHQYASCSQERSLYSRHPLRNVQESLYKGGTSMRGQIVALETAVDFVVLDLSGLHSEAEARNFIGEALGKQQNASVALIDTGGTGPRIPLEWITYTTGYTRSQRPWTTFTGSFSLTNDNPKQMLLYSPNVRCKAFEQSVSDAPSIQGTYVVGG